MYFYCEKLYLWSETGTGGVIDPWVWSCKTHGAWKCSRGFNAPNPSPSTRTLVAEMMTISALILTAATALA